MPSGPLSSFLHHFHRQPGVREAGEATDAELLRCFALGRDETAFATLMQRHGPLVLGVCRRVLHDPNDADDAFQATFLVLARKAGSVGQPDRLVNWLYGVALRVAQKARGEVARRRACQEQVTDMPAAEPDREADREDLRQVLDDEVQRLPEKFRLPILLCYLQGKTREEAGRQLGWSPGAVKGMLERGRELLRSRLVRRGVTLSAGSLAALLADNALSAAVPAALGDSTLKAALFVGQVCNLPWLRSGRLQTCPTKEGAGNAAALAEGVLQTMWMSKLKVTMALVVALGVISAGTGVVALGGRPTDSERLKKADPAPKSDEKAEPLRRQTVARLDAAKTAFDLSWTRFREGMENEQTVNLWSRRWLQAQLELSDKKADRDLAVRSHRERLQKVDEIARARLDLGGSPQPVQTVEKEQKNYETVRGHFPGALYGT